MTCDELIRQLEDCTLPLPMFDHRAHVQAGFAYLQRHGYAGALIAMAGALPRFAAHHGKHGLYHETVTTAFLALIHQRMAEDLAAEGQEIALTGAQALDWERFSASHADLFASDPLARYYSKDVLRSDLARHCFVLPRPPTCSPAPLLAPNYSEGSLKTGTNSPAIDWAPNTDRWSSSE